MQILILLLALINAAPISSSEDNIMLSGELFAHMAHHDSNPTMSKNIYSGCEIC